MKYVAIKCHPDDDQPMMMLCETLLAAAHACRIDLLHHETVYHGPRFQLMADGAYFMKLDDDYHYTIQPITPGKWFALKIKPYTGLPVEISQHDDMKLANDDAWNFWMEGIDNASTVISAEHLETFGEKH